MDNITAVDWLVEQLNNGDMPTKEAIIQANIMFEQQIVEAFNRGMVNNVDWFGDGIIEEAQEYYNETYGGNNG
jgi:hypothetical protein